MQLRNARYLSRDLLSGFVRPGDAVVDATAGNGHDTLALCRAVGAQGRVYAFDVQRAALEATQARLRENGVLDGRARLICDGHENMEDHVREPVRCVLFNLGWLPSGDHHLTTRVGTTLAAVRAALRLLAPGGAVSICCYPGHEEGARGAFYDYRRAEPRRRLRDRADHPAPPPRRRISARRRAQRLRRRCVLRRGRHAQRDGERRA